jgi:hypothetical protein
MNASNSRQEWMACESSNGEMELAPALLLAKWSSILHQCDFDGKIGKTQPTVKQMRAAFRVS